MDRSRPSIVAGPSPIDRMASASAMPPTPEASACHSGMLETYGWPTCSAKFSAWSRSAPASGPNRPVSAVGRCAAAQHSTPPASQAGPDPSLSPGRGNVRSVLAIWPARCRVTPNRAATSAVPRIRSSGYPDHAATRRGVFSVIFPTARASHGNWARQGVKVRPPRLAGGGLRQITTRWHLGAVGTLGRVSRALWPVLAVLGKSPHGARGPVKDRESGGHTA